MKDLSKLMAKKKSDAPMDENYKSAKMSMLQALRDQMGGMMKDDLKGHSMKKVEVSADDQEGLVKGLEKAKQLVGSVDEGSNSDELGHDEDSESDDEDMENSLGSEPESEEDGELSDEDMAHLERLLAKAKKSKR